jgi:hypothetical protein
MAFVAKCAKDVAAPPPAATSLVLVLPVKTSHSAPQGTRPNDTTYRNAVKPGE